MFGRIGTGVTALALAAGMAPSIPPQAQPIDAGAIWSEFGKVCPAFIDEPGPDALKPYLGTGDTKVARTGDGFAFFAVIPQEALTTDTEMQGLILANAQTYPEGTVATCALQLFGGQPLEASGVIAMADGMAAELLGPTAEKFGGPIVSRLMTGGSFLLWRVPGFPSPRTLRVEDHSRVIILGLTGFGPWPEDGQ